MIDEFTYNRTKSILDAVNVMLNSIGQPDVIDEEDFSVVYEAGQAYKDLIMVKREVLSSGWDCNTDDSYVLVPDQTNRILKTSNMLQVSSVDSSISEREGYIYSKTNQSIRFNDEITVKVIWDFNYNDIPSALRNYIMLKAVRRFRDRMIGADSIAHSFTAIDENDALMEARRSEATYTNASMLSADFNITRV